MIDDETPIEPQIEEPAGEAEAIFEPQVDAQVVTEPDATVSTVSIKDIVVRVGAELGRATLPLARAVGLSPGAVIELDRGADDPIDLYVNGRRFATGQLLLVDQTEWAIRIERVLDVELSAADHSPGDDLI